MNRWKKGMVLVMVLAFLIPEMPVFAEVEMQYRMNIAVVVDGEEKGEIPALDEDYENNMYISLKGLAYALQGTQKAFTPIVENQTITILTGTETETEIDTDTDTTESLIWDEEALRVVSRASAARNKLYLDGAEKKYYSVILSVGEEKDAFFSPISLALLLDLDMKVTEEGIEVNTDKPFSISAKELEESGYMQSVNALMIGDGTTGEIFYQYAEDGVFPIASTTKLMTYFVFMDAVMQGQCSLDDMVLISQRADTLSKGPDGVISLSAGSQIPVSELLYGMLLPSSNECALAVAEHVAGSQEAFVELMNEKAAELGLENAKFYNSHGLPNYEDQLIPAKIQNHMTAEEMFRFSSALVKTYPQILEYTSTKEYHLKMLNRDVKNSNAVLYNMENAAGLKTGTTNKAGACLITCIAAEKNGEPHNLLIVLLGADGENIRAMASELAARYAVRALEESKGYDPLPNGEENGIRIPQDPEEVMKRLVTIFSLPYHNALLVPHHRLRHPMAAKQASS